jgi:hypothetical protein
MKFKKYITEARLSSKDKKSLIALISKPKKATLDIGGEVKAEPRRGGISFVFNADNFELSMALTDLADQLDYTFSVETKGNIITFFMG